MKNNRIIKAYDEIQPDEYTKERVLNKVLEPKRKRRLIPAVAGMAAVLVIALLVNSIMPTQITENQPNSFTVRVYAAAHPLGEEERHEVGLVRQTSTWWGYHDRQNLYINVNLDVQGENIEHVEFYIEEGFFARRDHNLRPVQMLDERETEAPQYAFVANEQWRFDTFGNRISLEQIQAEDRLVFMAIPMEVDQIYELGIIEIEVFVRFNDGEEQTKTASLNFGARWGGVKVRAIPYVTWGFTARARPNFYGVDLDELILIPESVQVLVPYADFYCTICGVDYEWCITKIDTRGYPGDEWWWEDSKWYVWLFDPTGEMGFCGALLVSRYWRFEMPEVDIYKIDMGRHIDDEYIIVVVVKLINDDLVGMIYRMPDEVADRLGL